MTEHSALQSRGTGRSEVRTGFEPGSKEVERRTDKSEGSEPVEAHVTLDGIPACAVRDGQQFLCQDSRITVTNWVPNQNGTGTQPTMLAEPAPSVKWFRHGNGG